MNARPSLPMLIGIFVAVIVLVGGLVQVSSDWGSFTQGDDAEGSWASTDVDGPSLVARLGDPADSGLGGWPDRVDAEPTTYDFDGDGTKEILVHSLDRKVYVFDSESGNVLATLPSRYPAGWHIDDVLNAVPVGVLRPGEPPTVVIGNHAAHITAWQFVPDSSDANRFEFEKTWERRLDDCFAKPGMDAKPVLADLTGDGELEIVGHTEEVGLFALDAAGDLLWKQCWAGGNGDPVVADLDNDGRMEAIFASDSGFLSVLDGATGAPQWTFSAVEAMPGLRPGAIPVAPTVADITGDGRKEILFTARHAPSADPDEIPGFHMAIFAVHADENGKPEVVWMRQPDWAHPLSYTQLVVADVDDDGKMDIFGMDWNTIGHKPGNWENLGRAHAFRLDAEGNDVWTRSVDTWWSNKRILLSDSDGNGELDLVVNGARGAEDGIWRLSAETGKREGFFSTEPWKLMRGPVPVDLHGDGKMQIMFPVAPLDGSADRGAILVYDLGVPFTAH